MEEGEEFGRDARGEEEVPVGGEVELRDADVEALEVEAGDGLGACDGADGGATERVQLVAQGGGGQVGEDVEEGEGGGRGVERAQDGEAEGVGERVGRRGVVGEGEDVMEGLL